jgi:hypothetical protein
MNPMLSAKALKEALRLLSSSGISDDIAKALAPKRVAGPDVLKKVSVSPVQTEPASIKSVAGNFMTEPNPSVVQYSTFPKTPQAERQALLDVMDQAVARMYASESKPIVRKARNVALGTGVTAGAIPPSLLALYLLSQQDNEE